MAHSARGESSSSSDPCNSTPNWKYDVFLSFAGEDTRLKFLDHLDKAFKRKGIKTFKDDEDLERGGNIKQDLFQAIKDSFCAVVVISENYAKSTWCLEELQKILEASKTLDRRVFPIFYDVDPADVRHQRKCFALAEQVDRFREDNMKVQKWRKALGEIADLSGWDTRGRREADLIEEIVRDVWTYIIPKLPSYVDNLVGIESRAGDMMSRLEIGVDDRHFVGIWGMGGVGKTTLARVVFEKLSHKFEVCCFLANVRETFEKEGQVVSLQERLLSRLKIKDMEISDDHEGMKMIRKLLCSKKVLVVIDDVDHKEQLNNLAESPDWFGKGSRIILTTRDKHLLTSSRVDEQRIYEMKTMEEDESLELFSNKAFNEGHPPDEDYLKLSKSVVEHVGRLPLALKVLGSFLHGREKDQWMDTLDKLKKKPCLDEKISAVLQTSYDGLDEQEQAIFLDIACFFKGWRKKEVTQILDSCGLNAIVGIPVLIERTLLVETKYCTLEMHDLFQDLGRKIVYQESPKDVGKRSRLWEFKDIKEVLENNTGSNKTEAILWVHKKLDEIKIHPEAFSKMSRLRLLVFCPKEDNSPCRLRSFFPRGSNPFKLSTLKFFPRALKVVQWTSFPLDALPLEPQLNELVEINMSCSKIKQLWNNKQPMAKLKSIKLWRCPITESPDFSGVPNLKHLILWNCESLVEVHPSLGQLRNLVEVCLSGCENLKILPKKLETDSLVKLDLSRCKKVEELPEFGKGTEKLSYLDVSSTSITRLPESVGSLAGLGYLNLSDCGIKKLDELKTRITHQISGLNVTSLTELDLSWCHLHDGSIPDFNSLPSLTVLDLSGNDFVNLPIGCFSGLSQLVFLSLDDCGLLKSLPRLPPRLIRLEAYGCDSMEPLSSDRQLWSLVASLDHECRGRTKYEIYDNEAETDFVSFEAGKWPPLLRDFCAILPGWEIPSWFPHKEDRPFHNRGKYEMKVDIPPDSKWCGIVVCLRMSANDDDCCWYVCWSSKAAEDDNHYITEDWAHNIGFSTSGKLCIMVLELNEETCWRHLRAHHSNSLHIRFSVYPFWDTPWRHVEAMKCGWRVICKEEMQDWCRLNGFSNQATQPQLAASDEVKLRQSRFWEYFANGQYIRYLMKWIS